MVSGSRRSGGLFHGEVAQGRGGEKLATHAAEGAKSEDEEKGRRGGEAVVRILLSTKAATK